jgi:hypothetical protein
MVEFLYCFMAHSFGFFIRICVCVLCLLMPLFRQAGGRASSQCSAIMRAREDEKRSEQFRMCARGVSFLGGAQPCY